jgi:hypothetical protein
MDGFTVSAVRSFRTPLVPLLVRVLKVPDRQVWARDARLLKRCSIARYFATVLVMSLEL